MNFCRDNAIGVAPEIMVAISLRRSVGTPAASAAISSSRMVEKPMPKRERSIRRATVRATTASTSMTRNRYSM